MSPDRPPTSGDAASRQRLRDGKDGLFTSDLTVNEYMLVEDAGFEPPGLALGSSIYHIGYQRRRMRTSHELTVVSEAIYHARELAMERMTAEAEELEADGVVGVRLAVKGFERARHVAEFLAIGTAIRHRSDSGRRPEHGRPFTSDLSGQDFWTLRRTGAKPLGLVLGSCVYNVARPMVAGSGGPIRFRNLELPHFTQALYDARELAMARMQQEAKALSANGIVGVQLQEHQHGWGGRAIEFLAIGNRNHPRDHRRATDATDTSAGPQRPHRHLNARAVCWPWLWSWSWSWSWRCPSHPSPARSRLLQSRNSSHVTRPADSQSGFRNRREADAGAVDPDGHQAARSGAPRDRLRGRRT